MALALDEMSARFVTEEMKMVAEKVPAFIVSADGHVDEPEDIFDELPSAIRGAIKRPKIMLDERPGGGRTGRQIAGEHRRDMWLLSRLPLWSAW